jgi:hypothetical protein
MPVGYAAGCKFIFRHGSLPKSYNRYSASIPRVPRSDIDYFYVCVFPHSDRLVKRIPNGVLSIKIEIENAFVGSDSNIQYRQLSGRMESLNRNCLLSLVLVMPRLQ